MSNITIAHRINYMDGCWEDYKYHPNIFYSTHLVQEYEFGYKNAGHQPFLSRWPNQMANDYNIYREDFEDYGIAQVEALLQLYPILCLVLGFY